MSDFRSHGPSLSHTAVGPALSASASATVPDGTNNRMISPFAVKLLFPRRQESLELGQVSLQCLASGLA